MFHKGYSQEDEDKTSPNDLFWFSHNGKIINPDEISGLNEDLPFENLKRPRQNPFCPIWSCPSPLLCTWRERRLSDCHSKASCGVPPGRGRGEAPPSPHWQPGWQQGSSLPWEGPTGAAPGSLAGGAGGPFGLTHIPPWPSEVRQMAWVSYLGGHACVRTHFGTHVALCNILRTETYFPIISPIMTFAIERQKI